MWAEKWKFLDETGCTIKATTQGDVLIMPDGEEWFLPIMREWDIGDLVVEYMLWRCGKNVG